MCDLANFSCAVDVLDLRRRMNPVRPFIPPMRRRKYFLPAGNIHLPGRKSTLLDRIFDLPGRISDLPGRISDLIGRIFYLRGRTEWVRGRGV